MNTVNTKEIKLGEMYIDFKVNENEFNDGKLIQHKAIICFDNGFGAIITKDVLYKEDVIEVLSEGNLENRYELSVIKHEDKLNIKIIENFTHLNESSCGFILEMLEKK